MNEFIKHNNVMKYVFVLGMVIIFIAVLMTILGSNAAADVIVDQGGNGDYLTIQEGIDNAVAGENVFVWAGSYYENITIDKGLSLMGNGSAATIINASGLGNNAINITTEGVEITGFNITNNQTFYGAWANVGGFNIHDNAFYTQNWAIYMDMNRLNPGSSTIGDILVDNNEVKGTHGFHFNIWFEQPLSGSDLVFGKTEIINNILFNTQQGIEINRYTVFSMDQGSVTWGDILVKDNFVNCLNSHGIFFWGIFWNMTDVNIDLGKMDISGNNITSQSNGIYIDWWDFCDGIYGNTIATTQDTLVYNNDIVSQSARGLLLQTDVIGYMIYDSTSITTGDFFIFSNNITTISGPASAGIYVDMSEIASEMYNDSSVNFGNMYIDSNFIDSTGSGIDLLVDECGAYMYGITQAGFGNFYVTNNNVTSANENGINFRFYHVGFNQYDNSHVMMGEVHVENNDVFKTGGTGYGVSAIFDTVGTQMHADSFLSLDSWYVEGNTVTSNNYGIEARRYICGYETFDNSMIVFYDFYVRNNAVDAVELGMWASNQECGKYMEDLSTVIVGNMSIIGNNVSSTNNYGIRADFYEVGHYNYDESYVRVGWYDVSFNNFSSTSNYAGYVDIHYLGAYLYGSSQAYIGDITITDNEFWSTNSDGLYYYQFYENAYEMYDNSYVRIGDILVNDNYINAGGDGIYLETWSENAYNMYQHANADLGNIEIDSNTIEAGAIGIYVSQFGYWAYYLHFDNHVTMGHWQINDNVIDATNNVGIDVSEWYYIGYYMYGTSTFTMGNFELLRNVVNAYANDGIRVYIEYLASYIYGSSRCNFGNFLFNDNIINATNEGIEIQYIEYLATYMYDNSYAEFGNFEINNNDIIAGYGSASGYDGIYMYFYDNGCEMYGHSQAYFGHLQINDNNIISEDGDGIYFYYFYDIGSYLYDNSNFEIGNVEVCRNWINSNGIGIYLPYIYDIAYYNYDSSKAHFGDFLFNENNITSGSDGIYADELEYWAYNLEDSADAYFGNVEFNNNIINASGYGIDIEYFYYWGYDLYGDNEVVMGHVQINDNDILATSGDGIYVYYFYDIGSYLYQTSSFHMENFEICRNTINASGDGIEIYEIDELAYEMYDGSVAIFGEFLFNDNDIISGGYGFYNYYIEYLAYDMYDQSRAGFGNFEFNRNIIDAVDYGMYWEYGFYYNAYSMEDSSYAAMGHYQINDNMINVSSGYGVYFDYWYEVGAYLLEDAHFEMGNLEVCRNTINATEYGIYWYYFEDVAYYMGYSGFEYPGFTTFVMGDILFNDNVITAGYEGIYLYYFEYLAYEMYGHAYAEFGNFEVCRNDITITGSDEGIYLYDWYEWAYDMYDDSQAVFGSVLVNDNNITSGDDGIYMYEWYDIGSYMYDQSSATFGNFEMCRNVINSTDDGINIGDIEDLAYYNYGSSVCTYGDFLFNDNVITAGYGNTVGYGIYFSYIEYMAYDLYDQSDAFFGNFEFNRNIISSYEGGISVSCEYWGYDLYGSNEVIFGHFQINDNEITAIDGGGVYVYFYENGIYMEQNSYFWMDNFEISRNNITAGNETFTSNYGLEIEIQYLAYDNEDSAWCHFGDFLFNDNVIESWGYGIYVSYLEYLGTHLCNSNLVGDSYAEFGNIEFNRNQITSWDDGFYVSEWEYWGYNLFGNSQVHFGHIQINDNIITAGNATQSSDGMYFSDGPAYDFGSYMYDSSYVTLGDHEICRNIINATDNGMYFSYYSIMGLELYDSTRVEFQNFLVSDNEITAGGYGIYIFYFSYVGAQMYDESFFSMGSFYVNDNIVLAGLSTQRTGIELDNFEYNGYEMHQNAHAEFGSVEVCRNWVNATEDGIYIYANYWGATMYDNSYFRMDSWYVNDNTVVFAGGDGMSLQFEYFASFLNGYSQSFIGNLEVLRNTLNSTGGKGLEVWWAYRGLNSMADYTHGEIGDCHIQYNVIATWYAFGYGIDTGWDYPTDSVNDDAQAYLGDYHITHNTVYSEGTRGINIYHEGLGIHLDVTNFVESRSHVEVGDNWVTDNTITAPQGQGIYASFGYAGNDVNHFSTVDVGGFFIGRNIIVCLEEGIYLDTFDNLEYVYDDADARIGPLVVSENDVRSTGDTGIYVSVGYSINKMTDDASVWMDDIIISDNTVIASDNGIRFLLRNAVDAADNVFLRVPGLMVFGNVVDAGNSAFYYSTSNVPGTIGANVILQWGEVVISGNSFDGEMYGMFFNWQNPAPSVPQPVFRLNYNDIFGGASVSMGVYMNNIDTAFIETLSIDKYEQGIFLINSNILLMFNSTIANTASYDLNLTSDSYIGAVNCTFDQGNVFFEDYDSLLDVGWFMNVLVITSAGYGVPEANVTVEDVYSTPAFDSVADPFGRAFYIVCWEYTENITGIIDTYNDYTADADKSGVFGSAAPDPTMDQSKLVIIILGDAIPPTIIGDLSDSQGTTGDPFTFGVDSSDNFGIYQAYVKYRYGTSGAFTTVAMTGFGPHWKSVVMRWDYTGPMEYYFEVQDVGGFWVQSGTYTVQIIDNDAPTIISDNSNSTATTGDAFSFEVDAMDNIAVIEAHVVWWFGAGSPNNDTMAGSGPYNFTITVPSGSIDTLHYYFTIVDAAGNWFVGSQLDCAVSDNDAPVINSDNSDTFADLGQTFDFDVDITDNIGINETYLVYWFGTDPPQNVTLIGAGPYTHQIAIPSDLIYQLHYYFMAVDDFGNWLIGPQIDVNITDNIPPSEINDTSDTIATTGDDFSFRVNATDNIGISQCTVTYWLGSGVETTTNMTDTGPFTLTINIPSGSLDMLHYYFTIFDFDGNSLTGPQVDIMVHDNDAPSMVSDDSDTEATTGDIFSFEADFTDNIDIANAYIVYWFGEDPQTTALMLGSDPFTREIVIPPVSDAILHYYLKAVDFAGNEYIGAQVDVTVSDNDAPTLIFDNSDTTAKVGENFHINASFEDNIGIVEVEVFYRFGDGTETSAVMTGTDVSTYTIAVPGNSLDPLYYYMEARDAQGNILQTANKTIPITDDIPGTISNDQSDSNGKEEKVFEFQIDVSDNVGISQVMVAYWFGDDDSQKVFIPLTGTDGTYTGSFIPYEDGTLHYYFIGVDEAGNTFESDENTASISARPKGVEGSILPWILVVLLVIVIVVLLLLMTKKKKDEEEVPMDQGDLGPEGSEVEGETLTEPQDIEVDPIEEPDVESEEPVVDEDESEEPFEERGNIMEEEIDVTSDVPEVDEGESEKPTSDEEPIDDIEKILEEEMEEDK